MFSDVLKVDIDKDEFGKVINVRLSIRVTDNQVEVHSFEPNIFNIMIAQYKALLEE